jgi:hypothetical protein
MTEQRIEKTIFHKGNVLITHSRAVLSSKTYAMSNITSVSYIKVNPTYTLPFFLILIGLLMAFLGAMAAPGGSIGWVVAILGIFSIGLGIFVLTKLKADFIVRIGSASGE